MYRIQKTIHFRLLERVIYCLNVSTFHVVVLIAQKRIVL